MNSKLGKCEITVCNQEIPNIQTGNPFSETIKNTMKEGNARITKRGIELNGIYYIVESSLKEKGYIPNLGEKIKLKYDARCLDVVYISTTNGLEPSLYVSRV